MVSRQCCAHLSKEACSFADANAEGFEELCNFCLEKMQEQVLSSSHCCAVHVYGSIQVSFRGMVPHVFRGIVVSAAVTFF